MAEQTYGRLAKRRHPAHGVILHSVGPVIVFVTVCTKARANVLANAETHGRLRSIWTQATAWLVGRYVIMPDHIHLFAGLAQNEIPLDNWIRYWKSQYSKAGKTKKWRWAADHWDTRMRNADQYEEKWEYVCQNPLRHGLVQRVDDWPYQGELNQLAW